VDVDDGFFRAGGAYCHTPGVLDSQPGYDFVPGEEGNPNPAVPGKPMDIDILK
jgi:hypothetical protein